MPVDRDDEEIQEATSNIGGKEVPSEVSATNKRDVEEGSSKDKAKRRSAKIERFKLCKRTWKL